MPTTLRLFLLLLLGLFGLQPASYAYDAPGTYVSEAGYAATTNVPSQKTSVESEGIVASRLPRNSAKRPYRFCDSALRPVPGFAMCYHSTYPTPALGSTRTGREPRHRRRL
jgi:hypothetical protein